MSSENEETILASKARNRTSYPVVPEATIEDEESEHVMTIKTTEDKLKEAERIIATEVFYLNTVPDSITTLAGYVAIFLFIQTLVLFLLVSRKASRDGYWYVSYAGDPDRTGSDGLKPELREVANFSVIWWTPVVTLLSALEHLSAVFFRETYEYYIARHQNPFRWTEYTFSAPLVKVIVAHQVGVTDVHLLLAIFMLTAICIQCGATHESTNAKARSENRAQNWRPFFTAWMGHLTAWAIIFNYFAAFNRRIGDSGEVWVIIAFMFILDTSFAILFTLQWKKIGIFEDYVAGEKAFIILSLVSKTLLCWISLANGLR